jgi:hypothetical protein
VLSGSTASKSPGGSPPPNGSSGPMLPNTELPTGTPVKSTIRSARSARPSSSRLPLAAVRSTGGGRKPPLVADLPLLDPRHVAEVQDQEAGLAAVEEPQPVAALLDGVERPGVAVDHDHAAEELARVKLNGVAGPAHRQAAPRRASRWSPPTAAASGDTAPLPRRPCSPPGHRPRSPRPPRSSLFSNLTRIRRVSGEAVRWLGALIPG